MSLQNRGVMHYFVQPSENICAGRDPRAKIIFLGNSYYRSEFWMQPVNFIGLPGVLLTSEQRRGRRAFCPEGETGSEWPNVPSRFQRVTVTDLMTDAIQSPGRISPCQVTCRRLLARFSEEIAYLSREQAETFISPLYISGRSRPPLSPLGR